jgi:hypothetical protein
MTRRRLLGLPWICTALVLVFLSTVLADITGPQIDLPPTFKPYPLKYHVMVSDLDLEANLEAAARIESMSEEYWRRTKSFGGAIKAKMPVYITKDKSLYQQMTGSKGTAGLYRYTNVRGSLYICADIRGMDVWEIAQHECWHQFVHMSIGGNVPIWVNEGLAQYFAYAEWTGDSFLTGMIPNRQLDRVRKLFDAGKMKSIKDVIAPGNDDWWRSSISSYDQAWSMCYFLVHSDESLQNAFGKYISLCSKRVPWATAFAKCFGTDLEGFEKQWTEYWASMPENPSEKKYAEWAASTIQSFLARAHYGMKLSFEDWDDLLAKAKDRSMIPDPTNAAMRKFWLPPGLLDRALDRAAETKGTWELDYNDFKQPVVTLTMPDGTVMTTAMKPAGPGKFSIDVRITEPTAQDPAEK